jgi:hypothetical protein
VVPKLDWNAAPTLHEPGSVPGGAVLTLIEQVGANAVAALAAPAVGPAAVPSGISSAIRAHSSPKTIGCRCRPRPTKRVISTATPLCRAPRRGDEPDARGPALDERYTTRVVHGCNAAWAPHIDFHDHNI